MAGKIGFTLTEIVMAVAILALSFLPIIGVMGSSIKGTQKDEEVIKAVHLGQSLMNTAIQFPFNELVSKKGVGPGPAWSFGGLTSFTYTTTSGNLTLELGPMNEGRFKFNSELVISDVPVQFQVPLYNPSAKASDTSPANPAKPDPSNWGWQPPISLPKTPLSGVYHRYLLTVRWADPLHGSHFYSLVSFKAKLED
ncbi:hypothetical protein AUK22_07280 [bacterium CG2_30_54_10]|nr:MAG: hypothetical protein AUK22_07280 [bacterium CG2_30_54_10]